MDRLYISHKHIKKKTLNNQNIERKKKNKNTITAGILYDDDDILFGEDEGIGNLLKPS